MTVRHKFSAAAALTLSLGLAEGTRHTLMEDNGGKLADLPLRTDMRAYQATDGGEGQVAQNLPWASVVGEGQVAQNLPWASVAGEGQVAQNLPWMA